MATKTKKMFRKTKVPADRYAVAECMLILRRQGSREYIFDVSVDADANRALGRALGLALRNFHNVDTLAVAAELAEWALGNARTPAGRRFMKACRDFAASQAGKGE